MDCADDNISENAARSTIQRQVSAWELAIDDQVNQVGHEWTRRTGGLLDNLEV